MDFSNNTNLCTAIQASIEAGKKILEVYETKFDVEVKDDDSPLTLADKASNDVIMEYLEKTGIPVLSEEGKHIEFETRSKWKTLWIVDPLDGTKEFIKRNGEFTVNIALVENTSPILGVIYVPVSGELYFAVKNQGAYKVDSASGKDNKAIFNSAKKLIGGSIHDTCRIVASRSHMSPETEQYVEEKKKQFSKVELVSKGSSLKFCLVAENKADVYPRYAPTMEWDTAAGQIIVEECGKSLIDYTTGKSMVYNRKELRNNWFLVE